MQIEMTIEELIENARAKNAIPSFVQEVTPHGDDVDFVIDMRQMPKASSAVKLAARLVPTVRGTVKVESIVAGRANLGVEAHAGALPAHKLLGLMDGPISAMLRAKKMRPDTIKILPGGRVGVDAEMLLTRMLKKSYPGITVSNVTYSNATIYADATVPADSAR